MWLYRSVLLGLSPDHPSVPVQPDDYVPSDETLMPLLLLLDDVRLLYYMRILIAELGFPAAASR
jgi:hypothetical protein